MSANFLPPLRPRAPAAACPAIRVGWFLIVHVKSDENQEMWMLLCNRRTLQTKQIDIEDEIRGTLRVFGIKLTGRVTAGPFEGRVLELIEATPRLAAMVKPTLAARAALRHRCTVRTR